MTAEKIKQDEHSALGTCRALLTRISCFHLEPMLRNSLATHCLVPLSWLSERTWITSNASIFTLQAELRFKFVLSKALFTLGRVLMCNNCKHASSIPSMWFCASQCHYAPQGVVSNGCCDALPCLEHVQVVVEVQKGS